MYTLPYLHKLGVSLETAFLPCCYCCNYKSISDAYQRAMLRVWCITKYMIIIVQNHLYVQQDLGFSRLVELSIWLNYCCFNILFSLRNLCANVSSIPLGFSWLCFLDSVFMMCRSSLKRLKRVIFPTLTRKSEHSSIISNLFFVIKIEMLRHAVNVCSCFFC